MIHYTVHDQLVNSAILHWAEFNTNNWVVYDLLQSLTLNGPAWSWINGYQRNRIKAEEEEEDVAEVATTIKPKEEVGAGPEEDKAEITIIPMPHRPTSPMMEDLPIEATVNKSGKTWVIKFTESEKGWNRPKWWLLYLEKTIKIQMMFLVLPLRLKHSRNTSQWDQ